MTHVMPFDEVLDNREESSLTAGSVMKWDESESWTKSLSEEQ